jgi:hypothetical protein
MASLYDIFGNAKGLQGLLTEPEIGSAQGDALLQASLALMAAGGPSDRPVSFGQALAGAYGKGREAFKSGIEGQVGNVLTKAKIDEITRQRELMARLAQLDGAQQPAAPATMTPDMALASGGGPTNENAAKIGMPVGRQVPEWKSAYQAEMKKAQIYQQFGKPELADKAVERARLLMPKASQSVTERGPDGKPVKVLIDQYGNRMGDGYAEYQAPPSEIQAVEYITGRPLAGAGQQGMDAVGNYNRSKATNVQVGGPDKTFENENTLRSQYNALPQVKAFTEIDLAHKQIKAALAKPSAAGDLAAATKYMKILDPGSVVRESELGLAMAATGKLDQWGNMLNKFKTGQMLTPSQREEFGRLADEMYGAAASVVTPLQDQYRGVANSYKLDPGRIMAPVTMDSSARPSAAKPDPLGLRGK